MTGFHMPCLCNISWVAEDIVGLLLLTNKTLRVMSDLASFLAAVLSVKKEWVESHMTACQHHLE